ncbi:ATP-binding cassette domain-containing protein [Flavobacterium nitrogenifigens]|uniref:ABC-type multidrug transport system, ATPase component n=1 Tax=Flavobacterium nitrogenifigens TaxID=1617283 RepID=A0A521D4L9_9FLAO|nr:ATP-binding cassette domain-containing protein [Flavobacterium nitrogenifigens]KAF2332708.1 ATP-binding cassette domain-containing protein [Flavobacterium nitrogenifigens]SMO65830.1 ABC-type multidrug transport system, ATPase component [Flavobacterium nitrogenifigens]
MKKHILEISGIQKSFNDKLLLSDIYLKLETGQIIGLFGRNGSGKSTLLKIIFGIVPALDKSIFINGISKNNSSVLLNEIRYLHQNQFIPNHFSVFQTIRLSVDKQKIFVFCEDDFLKPLLNQKIKDLSFGELRYLQVKLMFFNQSKFVLLDEPFSGLSPKMIEIIMLLIKENSEEKGIILTDHNYKSVIGIATDLRMLKEGKLRVINKKAELVSEGYLANSTIF